MKEGVDRCGRVKLTNPDKVLYPATGTTKGQVFDYYVGVAEAMLPHIAGRAVTRKRWPNGVEQGSFFEKQLASSAPDWLDRATISHRSGTTTYPVIDTAEGLAWIDQNNSKSIAFRHMPELKETGLANENVTTIFEPFDTDPEKLNDPARHPLAFINR